MRRIVTTLFATVMLGTLAGCLPPVKEDLRRADNKRLMTPCPVERPLSCGNEIEPVCGVFSDGSAWDYNSKCLACARNVVVGYIPGRCSTIIREDEEAK